MSEVKKDEYIEISITKMVKTLFDNIKTFIVVVILGLVGLSTIGNYSVEKSDKTMMILFAGIILSLILGCLIVAMKNFMIKLKDE